MSQWDDGFEMMVSPDSGIAGSGVYRPVAGSPVTVDAVVNVLNSQLMQEGNHVTNHQYISVCSQAITNPQKGDIFTFNGADYVFCGWMNTTQGWTELRFERVTIVSTGMMSQRRL